jgi:hypothetical protein
MQMNNKNGKIINMFKKFGHYVAYLVGNLDNHDLQQFGRFGGAICTSHCRNFSKANGSPGCRTNGF